MTKDEFIALYFIQNYANLGGKDDILRDAIFISGYLEDKGRAPWKSSKDNFCNHARSISKKIKEIQ